MDMGIDFCDRMGKWIAYDLETSRVVWFADEALGECVEDLVAMAQGALADGRIKSLTVSPMAHMVYVLSKPVSLWSVV